MLSSIVEEESLGTPFALVIAGAQAYRIYMPPVVLTQRVTLRITIHLTSRSLKDLGVQPLCYAKDVDITVYARLGRLHRVKLIVNWGGRTREVIIFIYLYIERKGNVMPHQLIAWVIKQMQYVFSCTGEEII